MGNFVLCAWLATCNFAELSAVETQFGDPTVPPWFTNLPTGAPLSIADMPPLGAIRVPLPWSELCFQGIELMERPRIRYLWSVAPPCQPIDRHPIGDLPFSGEEIIDLLSRCVSPEAWAQAGLYRTVRHVPLQREILVSQTSEVDREASLFFELIREVVANEFPQTVHYVSEAKPVDAHPVDLPASEVEDQQAADSVSATEITGFAGLGAWIEQHMHEPLAERVETAMPADFQMLEDQRPVDQKRRLLMAYLTAYCRTRDADRMYLKRICPGLPNCHALPSSVLLYSPPQRFRGASLEPQFDPQPIYYRGVYDVAGLSIDTELLRDWITQVIEPDSWHPFLEQGCIEYAAPTTSFVILQTAENHEEIAALFAALRSVFPRHRHHDLPGFRNLADPNACPPSPIRLLSLRATSARF